MDTGSSPLISPQDGLKISLKDFEGDLKNTTEKYFRRLCEEASTDISHSCDQIAERMKRLTADKLDWFDEIQRQAGPAGTRVSQMSEFRDMIPAAYSRVLELKGTLLRQLGSPTELVDPDQLQPEARTGSVGDSAIPLVTPTSNDEFVRQRTVEESSTASSPATPRPPPRTTKRRLTGNTEAKAKRAYKRRRVPETPHDIPFVREIDQGSVFGQDYAFQFPKFGPGWYVIRCDGATNGLPYNFKMNPTQRNRAIKHFKYKEIGCHGDDNPLETIDEIIKTYGYRVTDMDEELAEISNEKLRREEDKLAKMVKRGGAKPNKAKGKAKEITQLQPPADPGPSQPAPVADMGITFMDDPLDVAAATPVPSIE